MHLVQRLSVIVDRFLRLFGRPARRASGRRGIVVQPYRGYGSPKEAFLIGRVFYQSTDRRGGGALARKIRDILRRVSRRSVSGAHIRAVFCGAETTAETDKDGYFRLHLFPADPVPTDRQWHEVSLILEDPEQVSAKGEVYVPPPQARLAVISDIDDTVMYTGVANKIAMLWRLFAQGVYSRTAFPGVAPLYRALHGGASGQEQNPMLYVSRTPWGIYEVLDAFFQFHHIPVGPILFLREWGISWRPPFVRRAADHKHTLIAAMMDLYQELPVVLIGDSGQHDPEVYRDIVRQNGRRILAVYIRNVAPRYKRRQREIEGMIKAIVACGSDLVLAKDSVAMAEHAASAGLIPPEAVDDVRRNLSGEEQAALAGRPGRRFDTDDAVDPTDVAEAAMGENRNIEVDGQDEDELPRNDARGRPR